MMRKTRHIYSTRRDREEFRPAESVNALCPHTIAIAIRAVYLLFPGQADALRHCTQTAVSIHSCLSIQCSDIWFPT